MPRIKIALVTLLLAFFPALARAAETGVPSTPEAWLAQMLDGKKNGRAFKDPAAFAEWLDAITEPRFMTALAAVAADPATYPKAMADAIDPAAARNWSEFTDPQLYLRWVLASTDPSFQQAIIRKLTDPGKMKRWADVGNQPGIYAPMQAALRREPATWLRAPLDGTDYARLARIMQPATPMAWLGAMANGVGKRSEPQEWVTLPDEKTTAGSPITGLRYRY